MTSRSLRVALITRKIFPGNNSFRRSVAYALASLLQSRGHDVVIFLDRRSSENFTLPSEFSICWYTNVKESFSQEHERSPFDIVHGLDSSAWPIAKDKAKYKIRVTFDAEATQITQLFALMGMKSNKWTSLFFTSLAVAYKFLSTYFKYDRRLLKYADGVLVSSQAQRNLLEWFYLYPPAKTHLLPIGTLARSHQEDMDPNLRKAWSLPSGPILLFLTSMKQKREFEALLHAFQAMAIKKPTARLLVLGSGPEKSSFERLVLDLALGSRVRDLGAPTFRKTSEALSVSDIVIDFQLGTAGLEPVLLDAMFLGKVVITSDVSPWAEWMRGGRHGFSVRMTHQSELRSIFLDLAQRPELCEQI